LTDRDDIQQRHTYVVLQQGGNLGDERMPALGTVLVGRATGPDAWLIKSAMNVRVIK
jgi:hypothetical protein